MYPSCGRGSSGNNPPKKGTIISAYISTNQKSHIEIEKNYKCTVEVKITFTYHLCRMVKVHIVSFLFYGPALHGTLRKRSKNGKSTVKELLQNSQRTVKVRLKNRGCERFSHDRANSHQQCCWRVLQSAGKSYDLLLRRCKVMDDSRRAHMQLQQERALQARARQTIECTTVLGSWIEK